MDEDEYRRVTAELRARTDELLHTQRMAQLGTWRLRTGDSRLVVSDELFTILGRRLSKFEPTIDNVLALIHEEDRALVSDALTNPRHPDGRHRIEFRIVPAPGMVRHCRAESRPLLDESDAIVGVFGYCQDITELKATQEALARSDRLKTMGQLTGGIAHDFNNLLTVITLNVEYALDVLPDDHVLHDQLRLVLGASLRGAELTSRLLSFARKATLRPVPVWTEEFFAALRPLLTRALGKAYECRLLLRNDAVAALVDPSQLDSAVLNLVINARDAMPNGGVILIEVSSETLRSPMAPAMEDLVPGRYIVIAVSDQGEGIAPEILPRVFEPFFTTKDTGKGNGLGLSMVYGFAKQSGGHATIRSQVGVGTTVTLYLPVASTREPVKPEAVERPQFVGRGRSVLVVEDQAQVSFAVCRILDGFGLQVTAVASASEALEQLRSPKHFDLLFTDKMLPGPTNGLELARLAMADRPEMRVLLTSGYAGSDNEAGTAGQTTIELLQKPYQKHDLAAKLRGLFKDEE